MEKNLGLMKPRYSEHILAVPWPFVESRFHCIIFVFKNERLSSDHLLASHAEADCLTSKTNKEPHMTSPRLYCYKNNNNNNNDNKETAETLSCKTLKNNTKI